LFLILFLYPYELCFIECRHHPLLIFKSPSLDRAQNRILPYCPSLLDFSNSCTNLNYYYYCTFILYTYIDKTITYRIHEYIAYIGRRREGGVAYSYTFRDRLFFSLFTLFLPLSLVPSLSITLYLTQLVTLLPPWCGGVCVGYCRPSLVHTWREKTRVFLMVMSIYFMIIGAVGGTLIVSAGGSVCVYFNDINTGCPFIIYV